MAQHTLSGVEDSGYDHEKALEAQTGGEAGMAQHTLSGVEGGGYDYKKASEAAPWELPRPPEKSVAATDSMSSGAPQLDTGVAAQAHGLPEQLRVELGLLGSTPAADHSLGVLLVALQPAGMK